MSEQEDTRRRLYWWRRVTRRQHPSPQEQGGEDERSSPEEWEDLVEQRIKEAMERGEFDNLRGKGQPLNLERNPFADPAWEMAHRMLTGQGFTLQWIEERRLIEADTEAARGRLRRAWLWYMRHIEALNGQDPDDQRVQEERTWVEARWHRYLEDFREAVVELNRRIDTYNLMVPLVRFQMFRLRVEEELSALGIVLEKGE